MLVFVFSRNHTLPLVQVWGCGYARLNLIVVYSIRIIQAYKYYVFDSVLYLDPGPAPDVKIEQCLDARSTDIYEHNMSRPIAPNRMSATYRNPGGLAGLQSVLLVLTNTIDDYILFQISTLYLMIQQQLVYCCKHDDCMPI